MSLEPRHAAALPATALRQFFACAMSETTFKHSSAPAPTTAGKITGLIDRQARDRDHLVAKRLGSRAIVLVLTGTGLDGASGAQSVRRQGGRVLVQNKATSGFFGMPGAAIAAGEVDGILPLEEIAQRLMAMTGTPSLS